MSKFIPKIDPEVIEQALELIPVKGWKKIERLCMQIDQHNFGPEDVFRWGNGGRPLETSWEKWQLKNWRSSETTITEMKSVLHYIVQARGTVIVPKIIYDKTFEN